MLRFDRIDAPSWMISKFDKTSEGFLKGRACVTNIGVFPYQKADGTVEWELRHPDDVFDYDSVSSLRLKPVTNDHPDSAVTPANVKQFQVGNLGDNPFNGDNIHLTIDMIVQDEAAISDIMAGKRELSCGYSCDVMDEAGVWLGVPYTKRQKNIRYNHVAIVDRARAGETARIKMDAADAVMVSSAVPVTASDKENKMEVRMADLKKIKLDGVEYDAEAPVLTALHNANEKADGLQKSLDTLTAEKSAVEAERDTLKDKVDSLEKTVEELGKTKMDEGLIKAAVARRVKILDAARVAEVEVKEDMGEDAIQKAVILKVFPKANLDGKDAVYLDARFDGAIEALENTGDAANRVLGAEGVPSQKDDEAPVDAEAARKRMLDGLKKKA